MKSLYQFIVKPSIGRYDNVVDIDGKELVVNSNIENHEFISKKAVVVSTPAAFDTDIKCNDKVYIHHNIFRRWYDQKGNERNGSTYFKDNLFFVSLDQVYLYYSNNEWNTHLDYCFVKPLKEQSHLSVNNEKEYFGILKYSNKSLERVGLKPGDLVIFTPDSEFEFIIEGERLYCMKSNDIAITHEHEGNEEEYNPSWA